MGMLSLRKPTVKSIRRFLTAQAKLPFTYSAVGATALHPPLVMWWITPASSWARASRCSIRRSCLAAVGAIPAGLGRGVAAGDAD